MERYCVKLVLLCNILVSPPMVIESFTEYSRVGWHLCSFSIYMTSAQDHLAFRASVEKSVVILIGLSLYVTWLFFPLLLLIFVICSLFCAFGALIIL